MTDSTGGNVTELARFAPEERAEITAAGYDPSKVDRQFLGKLRARAANSTEDPDWLTEANKLGNDFANTPMVFTTSGAEDSPTSPKTGIQFIHPTTPTELSPQQRGAVTRKTKQQLAEEAESKRAKPVDPLRTAVLVIGLVIAALIFLTSALFSFSKVAQAANWMLPTWSWLAWVVPGFVEAFIIWFGIDVVISQAKGRTRETRWASVWMFVFAGIAAVMNAAETFIGYHEDLSTPQAQIGVALSALAPLSVVLITKRASKLIFIDPDE